jgi:membrane associated rhomboid family serine protease
MFDPSEPAPRRQPIFNLPRAVIGLIAVLVAIHVIRVYALSPNTDLDLLFTFAFIPARVTDPASIAGVIPGGEGARLWSFVTYAFFHANWAHVGLNCLWLAAFGTPVAWRFGTVRFLLFSAAGAIGGAVLQLALHPSEVSPMIGASAAISAYMAGACRFVFATGGPILGFQAAGSAAYRRPAAPLLVILRDRRVIVFVLAWFGLNLIFGLWGVGSGLASGAIAWEAHIGGFLVGLLAFPLFDPVGTGMRFGGAPPLDDDWA